MKIRLFSGADLTGADLGSTDFTDANFSECGPFGDYNVDPHSLFMTLDLSS